ncbi:transcription factor AP-2 alpha [Trichinella spiralis]|nr:transcription factor AP-2 alpha [Trichinella spiralis]
MESIAISSDTRFRGQSEFFFFCVTVNIILLYG